MRTTPAFAFALAAPLAQPLPAQDRLDPADVQGVLAGVLAWEDGGLSSYSTDARQDRALHDALVELGVPPGNLTLLLDGQATEAAILDALRARASQADAETTLVFYYAGHGLREGDEVFLANYDIRSGRARDTGLSVREVADALGPEFPGRRVLLLADCCFSGGLEATAALLHERGTPAAALTSASSWNPSTGNWTFTQMMVEVFRGRPLDDLDGDGAVSLAEAAAEVERAMRFVERQAHGFAAFGVEGELELAPVRTPEAPWAVRDYVEVRSGERWRVGRIAARSGEHFVVELQEYAARRPVLATADELRAPRRADLRRPEPPEALPAAEALARAAVGGKYAGLARTIEVRGDFVGYGAFSDFGHYTGTSYAGHGELPAGYWVYVYPSWYIWKEKKGEGD